LFRGWASLNISMPPQDVYKYCRPWAVALDPESRDGALTPIAPYAVDNTEGGDVPSGSKPLRITSTSRVSYNRGWNKDTSAKDKTSPAAGGGASEREPHCSREANACIQHDCGEDGGPATYKKSLTAYQQASDSKALSRHHRHYEAARLMPHLDREARWYKCFRQLEGQWEAKLKTAGNTGCEDAVSRLTGTEFSVLPAGYAPKNGVLPQAQRDVIHNNKVQKYGASDAGSQGGAPPGTKAASKLGDRSIPERPVMAWPLTVPAHGKGCNCKACVDSAGEDGKGSRRQRFGAWAKAAASKHKPKGKLKGAEYIKAPIPVWLKDAPSRMKQSDILAVLQHCAGANKAMVQKASPDEGIFR